MHNVSLVNTFIDLSTTGMCHLKINTLQRKGTVELSIVECNQTVHCHYLLCISAAQRLKKKKKIYMENQANYFDRDVPQQI